MQEHLGEEEFKRLEASGATRRLLMELREAARVKLAYQARLNRAFDRLTQRSGSQNWTSSVKRLRKASRVYSTLAVLSLCCRCKSKRAGRGALPTTTSLPHYSESECM